VAAARRIFRHRSRTYPPRRCATRTSTWFSISHLAIFTKIRTSSSAPIDFISPASTWSTTRPSRTRSPAAYPFTDPHGLLVHVTHYNQLMWNNGLTPTRVIEHSVAIDPEAVYKGTRPEGITVMNSMPRRGRKVGLDLFLEARRHIPIQLAGFENGGLAGLGDIPYPRLHHLVGEYRFLFSPCRYTSLPLAVVEALTIGMPVVALATTELPDVIENGVHGYLSNDLRVLIDGMQRLIDDPDHARELGANAKDLAVRRFGLARFARDWDAAFAQAIELARSSDELRGSSAMEQQPWLR